MGLREQKQEAVRQEVRVRAWRLFKEQGFAATTVEQIARAAGMSQRSFFRYFTNKEDLVLDRILDSGHGVAAALRQCAPGIRVWTALRSAFDPVVQAAMASPAEARALISVLLEPAVAPTALEWHRRWLDELTPLVAERMLPARATGTGEIRARAVVRAAVGCLDVAYEAWLRPGGDEDLGGLLDAAMNAVAITAAAAAYTSEPTVRDGRTWAAARPSTAQ